MRRPLGSAIGDSPRKLADALRSNAMQKAFQFYSPETVEGSVSCIATGVPLKSVLVEIRDAPDKLAFQPIG
jgi:hypothetical protein